MEVTFTSVEFNADLFAMANNETFTHEDAARNPVTTVLNIGTDNTITFTDKLCDVASIKIGGLTTAEGSTAAQNQVVAAKAEGTGVVTLKFYEGDVAANTDVEIYYEQIVEMEVAKFDNKRSAFGEVILKYPEKKWAM